MAGPRGVGQRGPRSGRVRILVIEDDAEAARYLKKGLEEHGFVVDHADDGGKGLSLAVSGPYDVIVVDRMLPGLDGLAIVAALRKSGNATPALILSARGGVDDRVEGLRAGGDDYRPKPFALSALRARRRSPPAAVRLLGAARAHRGPDASRPPDLRRDHAARRRPRDGPTRATGPAQRTADRAQAARVQDPRGADAKRGPRRHPDDA